MPQQSRMLLTQAQIEEFQAEGAVFLPSFIPPDVLETWREQVRAACAADEPPVDLTDPSTFPNGRYAPEGGWPELEPNVYDLPTLQELVQQLGGGAFAPSHPGGMPWSPQVPMTRVIMPDAEDAEEWAPPPNGHLDGYAAGWGGGFMAFIVRPLPPSPHTPWLSLSSECPTPVGRRSQAVLLEDVDSPQGGGTAYWPRSHLANHRYFLTHPDQFDGSYLYTEPVKSGGHSAILEGDPTVGEVTTMTGKAGDAMLFHGLCAALFSGCAPS